MSSKGENMEEDNKDQEEIIRFMQDLEFLQCLANPFYLKYLSNMGYFDDDNFVNYLKYLLYFKKAEYLKYITFERCIMFLELLQYKEFRQKFKENGYEQSLNDFISRDWIDRSFNFENMNVIQNEPNAEDNKENIINTKNDMDVEK